jgi:Tol biopolymer transport system component
VNLVSKPVSVGLGALALRGDSGFSSLVTEGVENRCFSIHADGTSFVYTIPVDASEQRRLTEPESRPLPAMAWSPNRSRLAYVSEADGVLGVNIIDADGSRDVRLEATTGRLAGIDTPSWSPDGTRRAVRFPYEEAGEGPGAGSRGDIFMINADGTGLTQVKAGGIVSCW